MSAAPNAALAPGVWLSLSVCAAHWEAERWACEAYSLMGREAMSSDILDWFGSRRRERALKLIEKHMDEVLRVVRALERMVRGWVEGGGGLDEAFRHSRRPPTS